MLMVRALVGVPVSLARLYAILVRSTSGCYPNCELPSANAITYNVHIFHGMTQEQLTLLRESYNARFDHLARSIAPEALAPAALWYDHFINIPLANIVQKPLNCKHTATGLPPRFESYDMCLQLLRQKAGDGGTAIMALHQKLHSCFAGATARSIGKLLQGQPKHL